MRILKTASLSSSHKLYASLRRNVFLLSHLGHLAGCPLGCLITSVHLPQLHSWIPHVSLRYHSIHIRFFLVSFRSSQMYGHTSHMLVSFFSSLIPKNTPVVFTCCSHSCIPGRMQVRLESQIRIVYGRVSACAGYVNDLKTAQDLMMDAERGIRGRLIDHVDIKAPKSTTMSRASEFTATTPTPRDFTYPLYYPSGWHFHASLSQTNIVHFREPLG